VEGGVTTTYTYDAIDQITGESKSGYAATYTYDANGNRLTKTVNSVTENYSYDSADKLLSAGSKTYDYDDAGRTTEVTSGGVTTYLTYDYEGRVTSITKSGVTTNAFVYNGLDTRVSKTDSAGTKTYRRAGAYVTDPVLGDGSANFTPGISERRSSTTTFLHSALKNADAQTSTLQAVTGTRQYDAFGNVTSSSGSWVGPFGYAGGFGYQEDGDFGLRLLGHRYYDSSIGRFLSRDPAKDGRNWYVYCYGSPFVLIDRDGRAPVPWWKFEFSWQGALDGYLTGMNTLDDHFGRYMRPWESLPGIPDPTADWDSWASRQPGYEASRNASTTASYALASLVPTSVAASRGWQVLFMKYPTSGGFGVAVRQEGKRILGVDIHKWSPKGGPITPIYKWLHWHFGKGKKGRLHRPWQMK